VIARLWSLIGLCGLVAAAGCGSDGGATAGTGGSGGTGGTVPSLCGDVPSENAAGDPGDGNYSANVVWTEYGIPHVTADDWGSLGYGAGYAYARENYCVLMKEIVRANGESLRWFGESGGSLADDLVYRFFSSNEYIENDFIGAADETLQALSRGYAAGFNRYLEETGVENLAEGPEGCRNEDWVRPITEIDLAKVYRKLILRAGIGPLAPLILDADAPTMSTALTNPVVPESVMIDEAAFGMPEVTAMGSNAYAIGAEGSQTDHGILLGNPHFPWRGPERWFIQHLTIPGVYDVMGASLQGVPVVNIGFNKNLAWSHTVSTGRRFAFYELHLLQDDPMKYDYDGVVRDIETFEVPIQVKLGDGTIEDRVEEIYMTDYGPIIDLRLAPGASAFGGWPTGNNTVVAVRDANIDNTRALSQFQAMGQSDCIAELEEALKIIGLPWVNTIAADRAGTGLYADISTVPNITQDKLDDCADSVISIALSVNGFFTLNGSRSECQWGTDPDGPAGLLGFANLPKLRTGPDVPYVANSNDSYWLSNPNSLLTGFSPLIGREGVEQSLRTRQAFVQAEGRIAGTDGLSTDPGFTVELLQDVMYGNRNIAEELTRTDVLAICNSVGDWSAYSANPTEAASACGILQAWNGRFNNDSVGSTIWNEFWRRVQSTDNLWAVPFDAADPVNTPNTLNDGDPDVVEAVKSALGAGVDFMVNGGIPLDRPWGEVQFRPAGDSQIPIHGGSGRFMFSVISSNFVDQVGYADIPAGNSYIQTVTWDETECPDAYAVLTYSQSTDPASDHYADLTQVYSDKSWNDMPFCAADIEAAKIEELDLSSPQN